MLGIGIKVDLLHLFAPPKTGVMTFWLDDYSTTIHAQRVSFNSNQLHLLL